MWPVFPLFFPRFFVPSETLQNACCVAVPAQAFFLWPPNFSVSRNALCRIPACALTRAFSPLPHSLALPPYSKSTTKPPSIASHFLPSFANLASQLKELFLAQSPKTHTAHTLNFYHPSRRSPTPLQHTDSYNHTPTFHSFAERLINNTLLIIC